MNYNHYLNYPHTYEVFCENTYHVVINLFDLRAPSFHIISTMIGLFSVLQQVLVVSAIPFILEILTVLHVLSSPCWVLDLQKLTDTVPVWRRRHSSKNNQKYSATWHTLPQKGAQDGECGTGRLHQFTGKSSWETILKLRSFMSRDGWREQARVPSQIQALRR